MADFFLLVLLSPLSLPEPLPPLSQLQLPSISRPYPPSHLKARRVSVVRVAMALISLASSHDMRARASDTMEMS